LNQPAAARCGSCRRSVEHAVAIRSQRVLLLRMVRRDQTGNTQSIPTTGIDRTIISNRVFSLGSLGRRVEVPSILIIPSQPSPSFTSHSHHSHPLQQPRRRRQQRSDAKTAKYNRPHEIINISSLPKRNTKACAYDPNDAEGRKEDPSRLTTQAVAEENEYIGDKDDGVNDQFGDAEFFVRSHCGRSKASTMLRARVFVVSVSGCDKCPNLLSLQ